MSAAHGLHVVQVSLDSGLFMHDRDPEPVVRQLEYGIELEKQAPGSHMTILVVRAPKDARPLTVGTVTVEPVRGRWLSYGALYFALRRTHRRRPIDVITTQRVYNEGWIALLFARGRMPVVGQIHTDVFSPLARGQLFRRGVLGTAQRLLTRRLMHRFHSVRTVGVRTAERLKREGLHDRVTAIAVRVLDPWAARALPRADEREPTVLFVGRLAREKQLHIWLEIAALVARAQPDVRFQLAGDGPLRAELEAQAARLGIGDRVEYLGHVANELLPSLYAKASVFLFTSAFEGFARVVIEAQRACLPIVSFSMPVAEGVLVDGQTCFLHSQGDLSGMAGSVLRLLRDESLRETMGQAGRECARAFDPDQLRREWIQLLVTSAEGQRTTQMSLAAHVDGVA